MMDAVQKALRIAKADGGGSVQGSPDAAPAAGQDYSSFVQGLYQSELGRAPDPTGLQGWVNALQSGQMNQEQVRQGILGSPENQVQDLYQSMLGRQIDPTGYGWVNALQSGSMTPEQIKAGILGSPEYQKLNPSVGGAGGASSATPIKTTTTGITDTATPVDITKQGMPLIYTPPPYKDYGATAAAFRVASGLENLPAPFATMSPVVGGTPAGGEGGTTSGGTINNGATGGETIAGGDAKTSAYQQALKNIVKQQETKKPFESSSMENYLTSLYRKELGRDPDPQGLKGWLDAIASGKMTPEQVRQGILASPENQIQDLYLQYLGRAPDPVGLEGWTRALQSGQISPQELAAAIKNSPEAQGLGAAYKEVGGRPSQENANLISDAYVKYLGRQPESSGMVAWNNAIASGSTPQEVVSGIANSPEAAIRNAYVTYLGREPDPSASAWSQALASGQLSMDQVIAGIANSPEAQLRGFKSGGAVKNYEDGGATTSNYDELVRAAYKEFLGREPDPTGYSGWIGMLESGQLSPQDFADKFNAGYEDEVYRAYRDILNRQPDAEGMAGWMKALQSGSVKPDQLPEMFKQSAEYKNIAKENAMKEYYEGLKKMVPTSDLYSEKQGNRMYNIDIGNVERIPELGRMAAPVNVKEAFENSEIERLKRELASAKSGSGNSGGGGGGGGGSDGGGSNFGGSDASGTAGGVNGSDYGGGSGDSPGSTGGSPGADGTGLARGGYIGNNAIDNALRMIKADRR